VAKLFKDGDHVPVIELVEVEGKAAKVAPEQMAGTAANVGVVVAATFKVTVSVITSPHEFVAVNVKTTFPVTPGPTV
jgi:hypothetical protein